MKRFLSCILGFVMAVMLCTTAFAVDTKTYILTDLGCSIDVPTEYVVFTRDIEENDPNLNIFGLTKDILMEIMTTGNIYMLIEEENANSEILITMTDSTLNSFNTLSDTTLKSVIIPEMENLYKSMGSNIEKMELHQQGQVKYIRIYGSLYEGQQKEYILQYYTIYDNKAINITLHSYNGAIDSQQEVLMESIVKTIRFEMEKDEKLSKNVKDTEGFVYEDKETGTYFVVPDNWTQVSMLKERMTLDAKFTFNADPGLSILYGSNDLWAQMSTYEKIGLIKENVNNSFTSQEEIAEMLGLEKNKVTTVNYSGKEYYKGVIETESSDNEYGITVKVKITYLIRIDKGIMYLFQFSDDETNAHYKDFEALLESVVYP